MICIKGGKVIDPANGVNKVTNIYIHNGKIVSGNDARGQKMTVIDAKGLLVVPGLVDMHVHLREPGDEHKETIETGLKAAAAGGFTSVATMPNTKPVCDTAAVVDFIRSRASRACGVNVFPMGAISKGLKGEELAEFADMQRSGIVGLTDDGKCVMDSAIMRSAMEYAGNFNLVVCAHAEDKRLAEGGCMHEGLMSTRLGLPGIPAAAESAIVARDLQLCDLTRARYHVQHISTKEAVELVRQTKKHNVNVTCEATPHHWSLTDAELAQYDTNFKMNPPLRSEEHVKAIRRGLKDGTIDVIATDHAPQAEIDKKVEFDQASNGIIGLQTALPLALNLVRDGVLDWSSMVAKMTINPARILGIPKGTLSVGADADVTLIDPQQEWVFDKSVILSKSDNSPWLGKKMIGRAVMTLVAGSIIYQI